MIASYQSPPRTALEVYQMLPEGTRCELIDNILYMSPAPLSEHQKISFQLSGQLYSLLINSGIGEAFAAPIDVYLDQKNAFQPDLVFISSQNIAIIKEDGIHGTPDLIIEVLSPGTKNFDLTKKKKVYEKSGVKEYWVVDPSTKNCTGFKLVDKKFIELGTQKAKLISPLLKHTFKL
jgi:Uma2 family endonuclease